MSDSFEIDSLAYAGIVRIEKTEPNTFKFNCLVPSNMKEDEVSDFICSILDSIKDQVKSRKSWRFNERRNKERKKHPVSVSKRNNRKEKPRGINLKSRLDKAIAEKDKDQE